MSTQKKSFTAMKMLRSHLVMLVSAVLLVACASSVQTGSTPKNPPINLSTPEGQRQQRLQDLVYSKVAELIASNALADHDAVAYVKAALDALHATYALDLGQQAKALQENNAYAVFYSAMAIAYRKRMDVPPEAIEETAIGAMLKLVDPVSKFYNTADFNQLRQGMGKHGVIGVSVGSDKHGIVVVDVMDGSAAERAHLPVYSHILSINNIDVRNKSVGDVVPMLRGVPGSDVDLTMKGPDGGIKTYKLQRDVLKVKYVTMQKLNHHTLYIRLRGFAQDTAKTIRDEYGKLDFHPKAVILDLRNNSGGNLKSVLEVGDLFLPRGDMLSIKTRNPLFDVDFKTRTGEALENVRPVVVLVSSATASGAEALTMALHTRAKARVIGSRSQGSAAIRSIFPLRNGTAIKLTTGRMVLPDGQSWLDQGIPVNVCIDYQKNAVVKAGKRRCRKSYFNSATPFAHDTAIKQAMRYITSHQR